MKDAMHGRKKVEGIENMQIIIIIIDGLFNEENIVEKKQEAKLPFNKKKKKKNGTERKRSEEKRLKKKKKTWRREAQTTSMLSVLICTRLVSNRFSCVLSLFLFLFVTRSSLRGVPKYKVSRSRESRRAKRTHTYS